MSLRRSLLRAGFGLVCFAGAAAAQTGVQIGELEGRVDAEEGEALGFGVFVYGTQGTPTFSWDFGDGSGPVSGPGLSAVSHEFLRGGTTYRVTVTIEGGGASASRSLDVEVRNAAPRIDFLEVEPDPRLDRPVIFRARAWDPGDDELTWTWDFGDGTSPTTGPPSPETRHAYAQPGRYRVTLTVSDGEEETTASLDVVVGLDLVASTEGAMDDMLSGESGATSAFAGFPFAMVPMPRMGVGSTGDACLIWMGFWDDVHRVHVSLLWSPTPDRLYRPSMYPVPNALESGAIGPDQVHLQFSYLGLPGAYEKAKADAAAGVGEAMANPAAAIGQIIGNWTDMARQMQGGDGDNWMLFGHSGFVDITDVSEDYVKGRLFSIAEGPSVRQGAMRRLALRAEFTFRPVSDQTAAGLRNCGGPRPFTVERHTPDINERLVSFLTPDVSIRFTRPFRPATVNASTIQIGMVTGSGGFRPIDGELAVDRDARIVRFTPDEPLLTMVYYRVRVEGGPGGVLGAGGEQLPDDRYEWRFGTGPRNVPRARGNGGG